MHYIVSTTAIFGQNSNESETWIQLWLAEAEGEPTISTEENSIVKA